MILEPCTPEKEKEENEKKEKEEKEKEENEEKVKEEKRKRLVPSDDHLQEASPS